ncbi:kisspeptin 2 [Hippocampus zosterae]|uniref:kisspeptin 2 n=1 Tax=Hippocampus zosterae TaxID=109293 RepID=UPI00223E6E92|nr:kisspeptin 2 [Hippocampus zosterae]
MKFAVVVMMCGLIFGEDARCLGAALSGFLPEQESQGTDSVRSRRSAVGDFLEDPNLCFSLRENDTQQQLLCNDHRNKFNVNPFGLRFGKRYNHPFIYRRALQRARTNRFSPPTLFPRQLEVLT